MALQWLTLQISTIQVNAGLPREERSNRFSIIQEWTIWNKALKLEKARFQLNAKERKPI